MSRRPIYMRSNKGSYVLLVMFLAVVVWLVYGYDKSFPLQSLVENSELKGKNFQGNVIELRAPKSGIVFYYMKETTNPLVSMAFLFDKSGTSYVEDNKEGLAGLVASTIKDGAGRLSAETLRDMLAVKGIKIGFMADKDVFSGQISMPKNVLSEAAYYLKDILQTPHFSQAYVQSAKAQIMKSLETEKENISKELSLEFIKNLYLNHPYGRNPLGRLETLASLSRDDLKRFVKAYLVKDNLFIGLVGDLSEDDAKKFVDDIFEGLPQKSKIKELDDVVIDWDKPVLEIKRDNGQNIVAYASEGTCRKCDDFYPLYIANYLFGGSGINSKLNQQIREKEGLTYGGYSVLSVNDKSDLILAGFSATADKIVLAKQLFDDVWFGIANEGFSEEELKSAKNYLTASYNLRFASIVGIAEMLAYMQKYQLGLDFLQKRNGYIENVSLKQLNAVAKKYFGSKRLQAEIGTFKKGEK